MYQLVNDLGVYELERPVAAVDHRNLDAEGRKHRCVFDADDSSADDGQCARNSLESADVVARDDRFAVRLDVRGRHGARSTRDEDVGGGDLAPALGAGDPYPVRVDERRLAAHHVDSIARQLVGDDPPLTRYDFIYARKQLRYGRPLHGPRADSIGTRGSGGEVQDGLAKGLARD